MRLLFAAALLLLAATACTTPTETFAPTIESGATSTPTTATPTAAATPLPVPADLQEALVVNVVDGDTIDVLIDGREERVRYIGIDTPETVHPDLPVECFGPEASARNGELVGGETVGLERDVSERDDFGRLLRYVWLGERMVNAVLVEEGYAYAVNYPPDLRYAQHLADLEVLAHRANRGLWGATCPE